MADSNAFWGLIAQVIPVVALALVLEARTLAGRFVAPSGLLVKDERARWGVAVFVAALLFALVFFGALLVSAPALPFRTFADVPLIQALAIVVVMYGLILVVLLPLVLFFSGTTGGALWRLDARLPWGRTRRNLRQYDYLIEHMNRLTRDNRAHRLAERTMQTRLLVGRLRDQEPSLPFDPTIVCLMHPEAPCADWEEHRAKTIEFWSELLAINETNLQKLETHRTRLLRFMVTGTSEERMAVMTKRLNAMRGVVENDARTAERGRRQNLR